MTVPAPESGAALETATVTQTYPVGASELAGGYDHATVYKTVAAPVPSTAALPASPAFITSQMPRMHCQNLLTGQWWHRDVQGITSPSVTWTLNAPGTFTCTLAPPRADMLDATGNPVLQEWRDAIYLEESGQIKFGGILTSSTMAGPAWTITAVEFSGYPNGMIYEGPNYTAINIDALDAVRYIWGWLQAQPGGDLQMQLGTQKSGVLLGSTPAPGTVTALSRNAAAGQPQVYVPAAGAAALAAGEGITISGLPYTIRNVWATKDGTADGHLTLTANLAEPHVAGEPVAQVTPVTATLTREAKGGQSSVWVGNTAAGAFTTGETIAVGAGIYRITALGTDTAGVTDGQLTLANNLIAGTYPIGTRVTQVQALTPFTLLWYNSTDCGQEITSIQQEGVFDFRELHTWNASRTGVVHQLLFGVPRIGGGSPACGSRRARTSSSPPR